MCVCEIYVVRAMVPAGAALAPVSIERWGVDIGEAIGALERSKKEWGATRCPGTLPTHKRSPWTHI